MKKPTIEEMKMLVDAGIDLTTQQAALYLNLSNRTLEKYRVVGGGPEYIKYGRVVRYPIASLIAWKQARIFHSTSEQATNKQ